MNILQISTGFDISFNGGITNYVRNISEELTKANHNVTVLYSQDNGEIKKYPYNLIPFKAGLRPFHLGSVLKNNDLIKIESLLKEIKPDIIHVHMMIDLPMEVLGLFKKYAKLVISLHDYFYICNRIVLLDKDGNNCSNSDENLKCNQCISYIDSINNRYIKGVLKRMPNILRLETMADSSGHHEKFLYGKKLFREANAIIAVSNRVKEIYLSNGFNNTNFYVNHIGNYTAEDSFRNSFGLRKPIEKNTKIRFGFIGNLSFHKGSDIFLTLAKNSSHEFVVYGGIAPDVLDKIKELPNVTYHGKYNHNQLIEILKNVDIGLVLPVWEDNAPQVIFEFLNSGIPILGTKMGGLPDFINENNGILFENNSTEIIKIKNFIESDTIYNFYNSVINKIAGTKKAKIHMEDLLHIYKSI